MITLKFKLDSTHFVEVGYNETVKNFFAELVRGDENTANCRLAICTDNSLKNLFNKIIIERGFFNIGDKTVFDVFHFYSIATECFKGV